MEPSGCSPPREEDGHAESLSANYLKVQANRNLLPITPADSEYLSPNYTHTQGLSPSYSQTPGLSPYPQIHGDHSYGIPSTPTATIGTPSAYQPSERGSDHDDPFFGINFEDHEPGSRRQSRDSLAPPSRSSSWGIKHKQMPSLNTAIVDFPTGFSTPVNTRARSGSLNTTSLNSPQSPFGLSPFKMRPRTKSDLHIVSNPSPDMPWKSGGPSGAPTPNSFAEIAPGIEGSNWSNAEIVASPRVTVSFWGRDDKATIPAAAASDRGSAPQKIERSPETVDIGNIRWPPNFGKLASLCAHDGGKEYVNPRAINAYKVRAIASWICDVETSFDLPALFNTHPERPHSSELDNDNIPTASIEMGYRTTNCPTPGQFYYATQGGKITHLDMQFMRELPHWNDPPTLPDISSVDPPHRYQPECSQAAIEKFEILARDNDSVVSDAASWGTRRFSQSSILDEAEFQTGNFLRRFVPRDAKERRDRGSLFITRNREYSISSVADIESSISRFEESSNAGILSPPTTQSLDCGKTSEANMDSRDFETWPLTAPATIVGDSQDADKKATTVDQSKTVPQHGCNRCLVTQTQCGLLGSSCTGCKKAGVACIVSYPDQERNIHLKYDLFTLVLYRYTLLN
jgi:hypothetical protein